MTPLPPRPSTAPRPLRADARANRARLLDAADALFAGRGLAVPLDEIARAAGVGPGTLHRHFPTKDSLIAALALAHLEALIAAAQRRGADASPNPGVALAEQITEMVLAGDRHAPLKRALAGGPADIAWSESEVAGRLRDALGVLLGQAQRADAARADLDAGDLVALIAGVHAAIERAGVEAASARGRRLLEVTLIGIGLAGPIPDAGSSVRR